MKKHILCILLALCMVLTLAPTTAFARRIGDFECTVSGDEITITWYYGSGGAVEIPDTIEDKPVTSIGMNAFSACESLTDITLPDSLKDIGSRAFNRCTSLKSVNIPQSVTSIYYTAFDNCTSLESFTVDENNTAYSSADGVLFNKDQTILMQYPQGNTNTSYRIPESVTSIELEAFSNCANLESIHIPESVTSIGYQAFFGCTSLKSVNIPKSVTSIGNNAFSDCNSLESVTFGEGSQITSIGNFAFYNCTSLTSIDIPESVTSIGTYAFRNCASLTSIDIPKSVTSLETSAFYLCTGLESIFLPDKDTLSIGASAIPNTASQVKYRLDESNSEVTVAVITDITLGTDKESVALPAAICGYPVVALDGDSLLEKISSHTCVGGTATCQTKATCGICKQEYGEKNTDKHTGTKVWESNETQHKQYWECCNAVVVQDEYHTWNNGVCSVCDYICKHKDTDKNHLCDICGVTFSSHTGGEATCTTKAICEYCGEEYGEYADHALTKTDAKTPTCTEKGNIEYWTCSVCHKLFSDKNGAAETTLEAVTVNATGHTPGKWEYNSTQHWRICTVCAAEIDRADHTFSGNTCTVCGYTKPVISTYPPTVEQPKNGTVTVSPTNPVAGDKVTITPKPGEGYTVDQVIVTDASGSSVAVTANGDGTYSFTQPAGNITVKVVFRDATVVPFADVPAGEYYYNAVQWAVRKGITNGTSDAAFSPNAPCTRAQMVTFLWRAAGCPSPSSSEMPFTDVVKGSYYETAVLWAVENGITNGTSATTFGPNLTCSRAQFATFLWRSQGKPSAGNTNPFTDVAQGAYYETAVLWAAEKGITEGTSATTFSPDEDCTRAQTVTFLYRCLGN